MKLTLIISALLFSGFTFANTTSDVADKVNAVKSKAVEKIEQAKGMKKELSAKKDELLNKEGNEKTKNEYSKLNEKVEEAVSEQ